MAQVLVWNKFDYVQKMRARINKPSTWMDVMNVKCSNNRTINNSYLSVEPAAVAGTRGTAYNYEDFTLAADTLTIDQIKIIPMFIDEADRFQQNYVDQMSIADFQGKKISERIETLILADFASYKDFGVADLANSGTDDTTKITVSASNVDDLIRAIKRKVYANDGVEIAVEKGLFIVWRAADFELLEAFVQANGFREADISLKNGIPVQKAFRYMGVDHYLSNSHATNHLFAGVKKTAEIGILSGTFGKAKFIEDPSKLSGLGIVTRIDYGLNTPAQLAEFFINVNVN